MLKYSDLNTRLVKHIPELEPRYAEELKWWGGEEPGPHIIYGDVLVPHIISLLGPGDDVDQLTRIFELLEEMATSTDRHVREVVMVTICEYLVDRPTSYEAAKKFMGPRTRDLCRQMET